MTETTTKPVHTTFQEKDLTFDSYYLKPGHYWARLEVQYVQANAEATNGVTVSIA